MIGMDKTPEALAEAANTIFDQKLLVDIDTGRVLRADGRVFLSTRNIDAHPFMTFRMKDGEGTVFAGPDAKRRALARQRGEGEGSLDAVEYAVRSIVAGIVELEKVL